MHVPAVAASSTPRRTPARSWASSTRLRPAGSRSTSRAASGAASLPSTDASAAGRKGARERFRPVGAGGRIRDLNWMQLGAYLGGDDRMVLPIGSTEQHAYLSLETDNLLAEGVAVEAAEPLGVPVLPVLPYGLTPSFAAYPGSPTLRLETFVAVVRDLLESL